VHGCGAHLSRIVGWDVRGHAHGDPGGPVDQQDRDFGGQHDRLAPRAVIVRPEVNRVLAELAEHFARAFFEFFEAKKHLVQIYVNVTGGFLWNVKAQLGGEVSEIHLAFLSFLEGIFRDGLRRGDVRSDLDPRVMAVSLFGVLVAVVTDWVTQAPESSFESRRDVTLDLIATLFHAPGEGTRQSPAQRRRSTPRVGATSGRARRFSCWTSTTPCGGG